MLHNSEKDFIKRHIGLSKKDEKYILNELGYNSLDELISNTVPKKILLKDQLSIGEPNSEYEALRKLRAISKKNQIYSNFHLRTALRRRVWAYDLSPLNYPGPNS